MTANRFFGLVLALFLVASFVPVASGQAVSATITGYVQDSSEAGIPGASVTATNISTGVSATRETDESGLYIILNLEPGVYTVSVESEGFRRFVQENVNLDPNLRFNYDVTLQLGAVTEQITVTSAPPMLKTENTDVSLDLQQEMVEALPTLGRNTTRLHFLAPGTIRWRGGDTWLPQENPGLTSTAVTNGRFWGDNDYLYDGITNVEYGITGVQIINPPRDAIQEVKMTTSEYDAELGQIGGLTVQYVSKSGTNEVHGSLFWFNRNDNFFAANPFTEKVAGTGPTGTGTGPPPFNWNQFGGSVGGPIVKNKTFFFFDYQSERTSQGGSLLTTFPTNDFISGDMSRALGDTILDANGGPIMVETTEGAMIPARQNMIFDPMTGNPDGSGRMAFSCGGQLNAICPSRFNPVSRNLLDLLQSEASGLPVNQGLLNNNLAASGSSTFNRDTFDVRADHHFSDNRKIFGRWTRFEAFQDNPPIFGIAGGEGFGGGTPNKGDFENHHAVLNYTQTLSPTFLLEARAGLARFALTSFQWDVGNLTNDQVGIRGINSEGDPVTTGLSAFRIDGPTAAWSMGVETIAAIPRFDFNTIFQYGANATKIAGNHELRFGGTFIRQRSDFNSINESTRGEFEFNRLVTADAGIPGTGLGMGTFLLGMPSGFQRGAINFIATDRVWRNGVFFRDIWRVTPKLTINWGARWDFIGRPVPRNPAENSNYDPNTNNLLLACVGQVSCTSNVQNNWVDFSPRLGIAYKLFDRTVIRTGFGRSFFASNFGAHLGTLGTNFPMQVRENIQRDNQFFAFSFPALGRPHSLDDPVPPTARPTIPDSGLLQKPAGLSVLYVPTDSRTSYIDNWNFTIQQQLAGDLSVSVGYLGTVARFLYDNQNVNAAVPGPGPLNPRKKFFNITGSADNLGVRCRCQGSSYHSMIVTAEKRFSRGYTIKANFTWAKALDVMQGGFGWSGQAQNPFDRRASKGISEYNRAATLTVGHVWQLPFGKDRLYGQDAHPALQAVLGGWNFNGVTLLYSGFPIAVNWGDSSSLNANFGQRPDVIGDPVISNPTRQRWFNADAFASPGPYMFGNYGRNGGDLRGPGYFAADWSLEKGFVFPTPLNEKTQLEFRWEMYNAFNTTNLATPASTADSAVAGRIFGIDGDMRRMQFGLHLSF